MNATLTSIENSSPPRKSLKSRRESLTKSQINFKTNKIAKIFQQFFITKMNEYEEMKRKNELEMPGIIHD